MSTNNYIAKLKLRLDQAITQREHWKQLAENRNSIVVTEVCPDSRSVEEYIIDADSVRSSWRLIRRYREQAETLRAENAKLRTALAEQGERQKPFVWMRPDGDESFELTSEGDYLSFPLYRAPQPGPDVRGLVEALEWYEQQAAGCRKLTSEGDDCRQALDSDGGKRAQTALAAHGQAQRPA